MISEKLVDNIPKEFNEGVSYILDANSESINYYRSVQEELDDHDSILEYYFSTHIIFKSQ